MSSTMESPPASRIPPPSKKYRSGAASRDGGGGMSNATEEAIARRRAELRRLQQLRAPSSDGGTAAVLAMARNQLGPPPVNENGAPPKMPNVPRQGMARVRNSDIFPNAPKLVDSPLVPSKPAVSSGRVARTLEFPNSPEDGSPRFLAPTASSRAKSAPPMRPPPPPKRSPPGSGEAPPLRSDVPPPTPFVPKQGGVDSDGVKRNTERTWTERPQPTPFYPQKDARTNGSDTVNAKQEEVNAQKNDAAVPEKSPPASSIPGKPVAKLNGFLNPSPFPAKKNEPALVEEKETTDSIKSPAIETPRRDLGENLRQMADTPNGTSNDRRLVQELRQATNAKTDALRKVAALEKEIQQWEETSKRNKSSLETMLQIADDKGDKAALSWARQQLGVAEPIVQSFSQVGFLSPVSGASPSPGRGMGGAMSPLAHRHPVRKRIATPHPKRRCSTEENEETFEIKQFLVEATKAVPFEYTSGLATYIVRCPYSQNDKNSLWETSGVASKETYVETANAGQPSSLEIMAQVQSDGSLFILNGTATVRHKPAHGDEKVFENVDEMDKPLGCVMYIDGEANEKEYWLDAIYEEALATREAYCSSLISTASALQLQASKLNGGRSDTIMQPVTNETSSTLTPTEKLRPQTVDASVGTDDLPIEPASQPVAQPAEKQPPAAAPNAPPVEEDDASSDVLSAMMAMLISTVFSFVWLVLVRIPLKLFKLSVWTAVSVAILSALWLLVADDHGAQQLGAKVDLAFNPKTF